jgi:predicted Zn finger-like uncharacterized protein
MSMLTRCPACQTCYRVVPDQLRVSQGWVRCGQCKEIFDAAINELVVHAEPEDPALSEPAHQPPTAADHEVTTSSTAEPGAYRPSAGVLGAVLVDAAQPESEQATPQHARPAVLDETEPALGVLTDEPKRGMGPALQAQPSVDQRSQVDVSLDVPGVQSNHTDRSDPDWPLQIVPQEVSFLKPQAAQTVSARRGFPWGWFLLALGLCGALVGQWAYRERDQLALQFPKAQPLLVAACQVLQCQLEPVRKLDALVLEDSGLTAAGQGRYRLSLVIKNKSLQAVATPHVELTLTDSLDQILVRRVLSPLDMGLSEISLTAGQSWPVQTGLELTGQPPISGVSGYRLLAFYP